MQIPFVIYGYEDGNIRALLISDGYCSLKKQDRDVLRQKQNMNLLNEVHPKDAKKLLPLALSFAKHLSPFDILYRTKMPDDEKYHVMHAVAKWQTMPDKSEVAFVTFNDMTRGMFEIDRLTDGYELFQKDRFYNDPTTGLPNLNYLLEYADDFAENQRLNGGNPALLYFDVIGMQSYNSQYGFSRGDELLCLIAGVLKDVFPGEFVSRGYDDHFFVISNLQTDEQLSERIDRANRHIKKGAYGNTTGIQAGVCILEKGMRVSDAIGHARHALREVDNDLNITHKIFTNETDEAYWQQRFIIENFENALQNERIKVYYQCIQRLKTGNACALEALARWVDPDRGIISPEEFIPVLEKYHLLHKLDLYMVDQICKEVKPRQDIGLPLIPVSVNFSAQDFDYVDIVGAINDILEKYGVSRDKLIIEITERDVALATNRFREQMQRIRDNGYKIWIDDFGSGYSSLNVFSQYHFDLIKFDQAFLLNLDVNNSANRLIFKAMVDMAKELQILTLAEGMESPDHLDFLREIGCDMAQGFYFYKPESLESIRFKLANGNPMMPCDL